MGGASSSDESSLLESAVAAAAVTAAAAGLAGAAGFLTAGLAAAWSNTQGYLDCQAPHVKSMLVLTAPPHETGLNKGLRGAFRAPWNSIHVPFMNRTFHTLTQFKQYKLSLKSAKVQTEDPQDKKIESCKR